MANTVQRSLPASTSLAVWDVPATVVAGTRFAVKVGVKSSADCNLRGRRVVVRGVNGAAIGEADLGDTPWPDTHALYWTELSLPAPSTPGLATLSVRFDATGLEPPHADASSRFSVAVVRTPEHTLTVKVVVQETAAPLADVALRLGAYRATTDSAGLAKLRVCRGDYVLQIWRVGFEASPAAVNVSNDALVQVEAVTVPEENADRAWKA